MSEKKTVVKRVYASMDNTCYANHLEVIASQFEITLRFGHSLRPDQVHWEDASSSGALNDTLFVQAGGTVFISKPLAAELLRLLTTALAAQPPQRAGDEHA